MFCEEKITRFSRLTELMLENRGISESDLDSMEAHSVNPLLNIDKFCHRLHDYALMGVEITLLTDFDTDGVMSGIVGFSGLSELGFPVNLYVPSVTDGYGFTAVTIDDLMSKYPNTKVIVTGDVGVSCFDGVMRARAYGVSVLVTDHHEPSKDKSGTVMFPVAEVIVDPTQPGDMYENKSICGAYVLYQCLYHYSRMYASVQVQEQVRRLAVFAGIGTVSDNMNMLYENRALVRKSVDLCRFVYAGGSDFIVSNIPGTVVYRRAFYGLHRLLTYLSSVGKFDSESNINEELFGFYIAPMMNSIKRMEADLCMAYDIFFGGEQEKSVEKLYMLNEARKELVKDELEDMLSSDEPYKPYVWFTKAGSGIRGLLAQKVRSVTGLPCLVVNPVDGYTGSGRSPFWYNLKQKVNWYAGSLLRRPKDIAAGHPHSFGVTLLDEGSAAAISNFLKRDVMDYQPADSSAQRPDFVIDTRGRGDTVIDIVSFCDYLRDVRRMRPFGPCFEAPRILFRASPKNDVPAVKLMGSMKEHLKLVFSQGFEVIMWHHAKDADAIMAMDELEVWGQLTLNIWGEKRTVNFIGEPVLPMSVDTRYFA